MLDKNRDWSAATLNNFKWFINEREEVRKRKEHGEPRPWTNDLILHATRFANIYREHDKTTKFIIDNVKPLSGHHQFMNIVVARLINRIDVLENVLACDYDTDLTFLKDKAIMNSQAYQIAPNLAKTHGRETNRDVIIYDIRNYARAAYEVLIKTDNIAQAVEQVNKALKGCLRFAAQQMVLDYNQLHNSHTNMADYHIGEGARPIVDHFGGIDELASKLGMSIMDTEGAACEYRKYILRQGKNLKHYSYKPNSMGRKELT